jgi:hypothetical protein
LDMPLINNETRIDLFIIFNICLKLKKEKRLFEFLILKVISVII